MSASGRDNTSLLIQASAASGDVTSMWHKNEGAAGAFFVFDVTAQGSTLALPTFTVQGRVGDTTKAFNVAQLASTTPSGVAVILVYPGVSTAAAGFRPAGVAGATGPTEVVAVPLPFQFRVRSTNASTATVTWAGWVDLLS